MLIYSNLAIDVEIFEVRAIENTVYIQVTPAIAEITDVTLKV